MNFLFSTGELIFLLLVVGSNSDGDTALYGQPCNSNSICLLPSRALCRNRNESQANNGALADVYGGDFPGGAKENGICVCTRDRPWYSTKDRKCKYKSDADEDGGGSSSSSAKPKSSGANRIAYQYYQPVSVVACVAAVGLFLLYGL